MKKRIILWLTTLMLMLIAVPVCADEYNGKRLIDDANVLSDSVQEVLSGKLDELASAYQLEAVVLLLQDYETYDPAIEASSPEEFVRTYYNNQGFGYDDEKSGIILLVSMEERDWHMYIQGEARVAVNDYGFDYISNRLLDEMADNNFEAGIQRYVADLENFYAEYAAGSPYGDDHRVEGSDEEYDTGSYSSGNSERSPGRVASHIAIALLAALVVAFIIVQSMKAKMNTARPQAAARDYVKKGSFVLTNQQDLYLYSHTTRTARPKETSSSGGSSGGSSSGSRGGSGGGGKF